MKKRISLLVAFIIGVNLLYGQNPTPINGETDAEMPQIMKPSPKASSIMKYGEYPVSLYTGLIDITIPVYTIERNGIRVPIEFKYHASGIKYDDTSNEVGLGWTLIVGGVITHSVRGLEDGNQPKVYAKDVSLIEPCNSKSTTEDYLRLREVENGSRDFLSYDNSLDKKDGEMDMYSFSFLNHSGSFCFPPPESVVDESAPSTGLFIPNNGMKVISNQLGSPIEILDTEGVYYKFEIKDSDYEFVYKRKQREYYLTQIVSADKADTIAFSYDIMSSSQIYIRRPFINYALTIKRVTQIADYPMGLSGSDLDPTESGGMFYQQLRPPRLSRIDFRGGHVDFEYLTVNNLETWNLEKVKVYNSIQTTPLQIITLMKSKFSNGEDRLDKVVFTNAQNQSMDYQFGYKGEPINIHSSSYNIGIDYWGYFNGNYVPYKKCYTPTFPNQDYRIKSTDRSANEAVMQGGILNKIIYPTKGYSEFTYEAHRVRNSLGMDIQTTGGVRIREIRNYLPCGSLEEKKWYEYGINESGYGISNVYMDAEDFRANSRGLVFWGDNSSTTGICQTADSQTYLSFPRRSYFMSGSSAVYPQVTEYVGNTNEAYGKTIYDYQIVSDEQFYSQGDTYRWRSPDVCLRTYPWKTGRLESKQIFKKVGNEYHRIYNLMNRYKDINTSEFRNLRVSQYISIIDCRHSGATPIPDVIRDFCRYDYYQSFFNGNTPYDYYNFYTTTGLRVLDWSEETTDGVTTRTDYNSYNTTGLPTQITRTTSTGDELVSKYKYPTDLTGSVYTGMKSANILTPIVEKETYKNNNQFLKKEINNYKLYSPQLYAPDNIQLQYRDGTIDTRMKYAYDLAGNIKEVVKDEYEKVVYLWGYNHVYPIAEIRDVTYWDVIMEIPESTLKTISGKKVPSYSDWSLIEGLKTSLPNAQITIHKYKPLVGVIETIAPSGTKTFYEYDDFGRLVCAKDHFGKVLQSHNYHYKDY